MLRIGFVGAGGIGNHHAREVLRREDTQVAALCDPSEAAQGKAEVQAPPICGLRVAQLTEAACKSAQSGQPEAVG